MPKTTNTTNPQPAVPNIQTAFATMASGRKKSAFIADTRDFVGESVRVFGSVAKTVTLLLDENRAEVYSEMDPKTFETMIYMRANGL